MNKINFCITGDLTISIKVENILFKFLNNHNFFVKFQTHELGILLNIDR